MADLEATILVDVGGNGGLPQLFLEPCVGCPWALLPAHLACSHQESQAIPKSLGWKAMPFPPGLEMGKKGKLWP